MLVEIKKNTSGAAGGNKILVEECIERTPHIGEVNPFDMILFFCKELRVRVQYLQEEGAEQVGKKVKKPAKPGIAISKLLTS